LRRVKTIERGFWRIIKAKFEGNSFAKCPE